MHSDRVTASTPDRLFGMWQTLIAGLAALTGVGLGVFLEPLRMRFARKSAARERLIELCAELIEAASASADVILELNHVHRVRHANRPTPQGQVNQMVEEGNAVRSRIRNLSAVLRLYGGDEIANAAQKVKAADRAMFELLKEEPNPVDVMTTPPRLQGARDELDAAIEAFASLAHKNGG